MQERRPASRGAGRAPAGGVVATEPAKNSRSPESGPDPSLRGDLAGEHQVVRRFQSLGAGRVSLSRRPHGPRIDTSIRPVPSDQEPRRQTSCVQRRPSRHVGGLGASDMEPAVHARAGPGRRRRSIPGARRGGGVEVEGRRSALSTLREGKSLALCLDPRPGDALEATGLRSRRTTTFGARLPVHIPATSARRSESRPRE